MNQRVCVLILLVVLALVAVGQAQTFTTLFSFTGRDGGFPGGFPGAGVIQDGAGNLYGTASWGGEQDNGVVYEVDTAGTETVLYSFNGNPDGADPEAPLARNKAGNLYGTTALGGTGTICVEGCGTVFRIGPSGNETVLYSFTGGSDGCSPLQGLVLDKSGNMFGTTAFCGSSGNGTIFKVDSAGNFTLLHTFTGSSSDGARPTYGHLMMSKSSSLYGTAVVGGADNAGVLYELRKNGTLTLLHSFTGGTTDGCEPYGSVALDRTGNLYGTTSGCGSARYGTIWRVSKYGKEIILHSIAPADGGQPVAGVTLDSKGNLYGVTFDTGRDDASGTLYEFLSRSGELIVLQGFDGLDGANPVGEVLRTAKGTLFGTTGHGGTYHYCDAESSCGTVWKYVP